MDLLMETVDPKYYQIEDENFQRVFMKFHRIIVKNGDIAVKEVKSIYEFIVELEDKTLLNH